MKKYVIWGLLLALLLCGCGKEEEINPDAVNFAECPTIAIEDVETLPLMDAGLNGSVSEFIDQNAVQQGFFCLKWEEIDDGAYSDEKQFLHFNDFTTGEIYSVCAKANCTHDDYLCNAYLKNATHLYYDGSYLYYFTGNTCQFWRMNSDGTDRKMLFECNENAESGALMNIESAIYLDGKVYFNTFGAIMNPETLEIETGEHICVGDLKTGKYTVLPIAFEANKGGSTLNLIGMYDSLLVIRHSNTLSSIGGYQKNEETVCLLDVNSLEVTVLCQWQWDTNDDGVGVSFVTESIDEGYMIFKIHSSSYQHPTYADGSVVAVGPGNRLFIDLSQEKAYRMTNQDALSNEEIVVEGKWIHLRWNNDHTLVEKVVQDLATGEINLLPETVRDFNFNYTIQSVGDYFIVGVSSEDGYINGRILKKDYWAGKMEIIRFPEWMILS